MDRRTKILVSVFAASAAMWLAATWVYPKWLKPLFTIKTRVADAQTELNNLLEGEAAVEHARFTYKTFLERCGSLDAAKLENDLRERLNRLIAIHHLDETNVSGGSNRMSSFGKTDARKMTLSVDATGTLEGAIGFLRSVAELPHLVRVGNVSIYPSQDSRKKRKGKRVERVQMRVPIEVLVIPQHKMLGRKLTEEELRQPEQIVRHEDRNYAQIWNKTPFTEYIELDPMVVSAGSDLTAEVGKRGIMLNGTATGGDGDYTITWAPSDHLSNPNSLRPRIDTKEPFTQIYTLTVTDTSDNSGTAQVEVAITEKPPAVVEKQGSRTTPPPRDLGPQRWRDGQLQQLVMAMASRNGDSRQAEIMVYHSRTKANTYFRPGDEFDGGELLFVHPRGAIVRRQSDLFVYPIGANISDDVKADVADDYPNLKLAAKRIQEALDKHDAEEKLDTESGEPDSSKRATDLPAPGEAVGATKTPSSKPAETVAVPAAPVEVTNHGDETPAAASHGSEVVPAATGAGSVPPTSKGPPATGPINGKRGPAEAGGKDKGAAKSATKAVPAPKRGSRNATKARPSKRGKGRRTIRRPTSRRKGSGKRIGKK